MRQKVVIPAHWARVGYWPAVCLGHGDGEWRAHRVTYLSRPPLPALALLFFGLLPYFVISHFLCRRLDTAIPECRRCRTARLLHPAGLIAVLVIILLFPVGAILLNYHPDAYAVFTQACALLIAAATLWWVFCETRWVRGRLSFDQSTVTLRGVDPAVAAMFEEMRALPTPPTQPVPTVVASTAGQFSGSTSHVPGQAAQFNEAVPFNQTVPFNETVPFNPASLAPRSGTAALPPAVPAPTTAATAEPPHPERPRAERPHPEGPHPEGPHPELTARERADRALAERATAGHRPGAAGHAMGKATRRELPPLPPLPTIAEVSGGGGGAGRFGAPPAAVSSAPARPGTPPAGQFGGAANLFGSPRPLTAPAEGIAVPGLTLLPRRRR